METLPLRNTARVLRVLVLITLAVTAAVMLMVPGLTVLLADGGPATATAAIMALLSPGGAESLGLKQPLMFFLQCYLHTWERPYSAMLTLFYWICDTCCGVILWQAKGVLDNLLRGLPFCRSNGAHLARAAISCWVISGCAVARAIFWFRIEGDLSPLFTYNTLFIPGFFMAGLLFQVMAALFRQAAELKEDQDLTI